LFSRDLDKIDALLARTGYFVLATNNAPMSPAGALDIYRRKVSTEKAFVGMKNQPDMRRLRAHSDTTAECKLFCGFVALSSA